MQSVGFYLQSSISPNKVCVVPKSFQSKSRRESIKSLLNLGHNINYGVISQQTISKIKSAINLIVSTADNKVFQLSSNSDVYNFKVNFVTLTLPSKQIHDDVTIKNECLNQLLTEWRKREPSLRYMWRAEKQKNGNIHFHLLTNCFYHFKYLRADWNRICNKLGYVDRYSSSFEGMSFESYCSKFQSTRVSKKLLQHRYEEGISAGWRNPNSTDVHSIRKINDVAAYVSKYCAKQSPGNYIKDPQFKKSNVCKRQKLHLSVKEIIAYRANKNIIKGKVWGCDSQTAAFKNTTVTEFCEDWAETTTLIKKAASTCVVKEYITIYYGDFHNVLMSQASDTAYLYQYSISNYLFPK